MVLLWSGEGGVFWKLWMLLGLIVLWMRMCCFWRLILKGMKLMFLLVYRSCFCNRRFSIFWWRWSLWVCWGRGVCCILFLRWVGLCVCIIGMRWWCCCWCCLSSLDCRMLLLLMLLRLLVIWSCMFCCSFRIFGFVKSFSCFGCRVFYIRFLYVDWFKWFWEELKLFKFFVEIDFFFFVEWIVFKFLVGRVFFFWWFLCVDEDCSCWIL